MKKLSQNELVNRHRKWLIKKFKILPMDLNDQEVEELFNYRYYKPLEIFLQNNKVSSYNEILENIRFLKSFGTKISLNKLIVMYGPKEGLSKYNEYCNSRKITEETLKLKYGEDEGLERWLVYKQKQAYSNTLEYKQLKYGWSKEKFDEYNKSRATTKQLSIKRYGEEIGLERWESYRNMQAYTNTKSYLGDRYEEINKRKGITLPNFIMKYGVSDGPIKYAEYFNSSKDFYSKISQKLFYEIIKYDPFKLNKCYFAEHNKEYGILDHSTGTYKKYDFVCPAVKFAIEFHGDHYHGNPKIYGPNSKLRGKGCTQILAKEVWEKDLYRSELMLKERNIQLITVWESDYMKNPNEVIERILSYAKSRT